MFDLLTVAAAYHRLSTEAHDYRYITVEGFNDKNLSIFDDIESRDISLANTIRQYYQNKLLTVSLCGSQLSPFRKDLSKLLYNNNITITDNFIKLALSMPEFYFYDLEIDELKMVLFNKSEKVEKGYIKLLKTLHRKKKTEYWFIDEQNMLIIFKIDRTNNLMNMWTAYLKANNNMLETSCMNINTRDRIVDGLKYKEILQIF